MRRSDKIIFYVLSLVLAFALGVTVTSTYMNAVLAEALENNEPAKVEPTVIIKTVEVPVKEVEKTEKTDEAEETNGYYAEYEITAYCPCEYCCGKTDGITATGTKATEGRTIAVDPTVIPYGTEVVINGNTYVAEDCGGAIKGSRIDVYFDSHAEALEFGRQNLEIFVVEG